jgi:hypothetical protein
MTGQLTAFEQWHRQYMRNRPPGAHSDGPPSEESRATWNAAIAAAEKTCEENRIRRLTDHKTNDEAYEPTPEDYRTAGYVRGCSEAAEAIEKLGE